ncbi:Protein disulfide-isomerase 5-4 [Asimina triloba]
MDGRILLGKVDCTQEMDLCRRENHGHHEHESYYGERDTDSLVTTMEGLVSPIPLETDKHESEINGTDMAAAAKRPAPSAGGCRVEGFVRVKKVPGNLVISAHSGAHSFDASLINVSHVISHFSFGRQLTLKMLTEVKRLSPHLGESVDRLTGRAYITRHDDANANVTGRNNVEARGMTAEENQINNCYFSTMHSKNKGSETLSWIIGRMKGLPLGEKPFHPRNWGRDLLVFLGDIYWDWAGIQEDHVPQIFVVGIEHYLQIVKTEVTSRRHSEKLIDYEYTSHSSLAHSPDIPVAKFHFVPSAMQVLITENERSFSHFITNVCAIIGGVFTVAGILDSIMHNTMRLMKKMELGKQF